MTVINRDAIGGLIVVTTGHQKKALRDVLADAVSAGKSHVMFNDGVGLGDDLAHPMTDEEIAFWVDVEKHQPDTWPEHEGFDFVLFRKQGDDWEYRSRKFMAQGRTDIAHALKL